MRTDRMIHPKIQEAAIPGHAYHQAVVVIPAYNEERFIGSVILRALKLVDTIIVVDDGSMDATAEVAQAAGAIVMHHERNKGKGVALNTGFCYARKLEPEMVITLDADGQHIPEEIIQLSAPIRAGIADIVVGSRYLEKTSRVPLHRIWGHRFFNIMTGQASGLSLSDSQSGFRAFSRRALETITFKSNGFSVESEMQFLAFEKKLNVVEVPITIHYTDKPKRSVIVHGLIVLNGIMHLVGQYRPLFFLGLTGIFLIAAGLVLALPVIRIYRASQVIPLGYFLISVALSLSGLFSLFTGIILHSVRGLLLDLLRKGESTA
ncbi:MAG TPA: glycosyltransferase family 2 protein [Anaerolineales bacterium]|nr:glycosyltransferase family 2 protein [Anaerolineales bacterium]HLO28391.1 glycosyltransferase family 2 protein [Anaerolineales bacterium]